MTRSRWLTTAAFAGVVGLYTVYALTKDLWDDALFFQRFGHNVVAHGVAGWNVEDGPVHGNTSQLFQAVAVAITALFPGWYHVAIKLVLGLSTVATFGIGLGVLGRWQPATERADPGPPVVLFCALSAPTALLLIGSGMETAFAGAVLATALWVLAKRDGAPISVGWAAATVGVQILVYLARPDLILLSLGSAVVLWFEPGVPLRRQRRLLVLGGLTLAGLALTLMALRLGYGTAFPLSFYLKSRLLSPYDAEYLQLGVAGERRTFLTWVAFTGPFLLLALFGRWRFTLVLVGPALGFVAYHYLSTIGVMGYHSRFFQPATVPIALAAALAWPRFTSGRVALRVLPILAVWPALVAIGFHYQWVEQRDLDLDFYLAWIPEDLWWAAVGTTVVLLVCALGVRRWPAVIGLVPVAALAGVLWAIPPGKLPALDDGASVDRIRSRMKAMKGIDVVRDCLPEPVHVYHSELGVPGVMFPESRITDLSGLMNPALVFSHPTFDDYCLADPPDVLFLPHRTHERLNREILDGRCIGLFARPTGIGSSSSALYVRRDLLDRFTDCQRDRRAEARQRE